MGRCRSLRRPGCSCNDRPSQVSVAPETLDVTLDLHCLATIAQVRFPLHQRIFWFRHHHSMSLATIAQVRFPLHAFQSKCNTRQRYSCNDRPSQVSVAQCGVDHAPNRSLCLQRSPKSGFRCTLLVGIAGQSSFSHLQRSPKSGFRCTIANSDAGLTGTISNLQRSPKSGFRCTGNPDGFLEQRETCNDRPSQVSVAPRRSISAIGRSHWLATIAQVRFPLHHDSDL